MSDAYRVILLPEAFEDLSAIVDYIEQESPKNAAVTIDRILRAAQSLSQLPHRYKVHRWKRHPDRTIHSMPVPPFIIYYRIIERPPTVRVLTICHGARRPSRFERRPQDYIIRMADIAARTKPPARRRERNLFVPAAI